MSNPGKGTVLSRALVAALFVLVASAPSASAASLFFFKGKSKAPNEKICLSFATDQAKRLGLQNVKSDKLSVSGNKSNFEAILTCVGTFIVVMVAGDTGTDGGPLAKQLFDAVKGEQIID
jgi:hypothetical protein